LGNDGYSLYRQHSLLQGFKISSFIPGSLQFMIRHCSNAHGTCFKATEFQNRILSYLTLHFYLGHAVNQCFSTSGTWRTMGQVGYAVAQIVTSINDYQNTKMQRVTVKIHFSAWGGGGVLCFTGDAPVLFHKINGGRQNAKCKGTLRHINVVL
jgi:hypothetical protein